MLAPAALLLSVLLMCIGSAVDFSRAVTTRSKLAAAADAGAIAGARALSDASLTDAQVTSIANKYFTETTSKLEGDAASKATPTITITRSTGKITINTTASQPTLFGKLLGFDQITLPVTATAQASGVDVELAMVLDVTGSMEGQKLTDLKSAAKNVIDILLTEGNAYTKRRISVIPFSASVNAGSLTKAVTGNSAKPCTYERGGSEKFTDAAPTDSSTYLGSSNKIYCPVEDVQGLTTNSTTLKSVINSMEAGGGTAGHIGLAWGWYSISPKWNSVFTGSAEPAAYDKTKTLKAVLLMTDGDFNTQYVWTNGTSFDQADALCTSMKNAGVVVYTVGFFAPVAAETFLRTCATSSDHYYSTSTGTELANAFESIAKSLNKLKLTE